MLVIIIYREGGMENDGKKGLERFCMESDRTGESWKRGQWVDLDRRMRGMVKLFG